MNDIEAIKVLDILRHDIGQKAIMASGGDTPIARDRHEAECAALTHAIDAMKAKSDAEVVCEWLKERYTSSVRWSITMGEWVISNSDFHAPTLADLAKKIGDGK